MNRTHTFVAAGAGLLVVGYLVWREKQRTQTFALGAGRLFAFTVQGTPTGAPPSVASAQAVFAAQGLPLTVTGVAVTSTSPLQYTVTGATLAATGVTGGQVAAAAGVTGGTFSVAGGDAGPVVAASVSGLGRMRRVLRAVR